MSPFREANSCLAPQAISRNFHSSVHKAQHWSISWAHFFQPTFSKILTLRTILILFSYIWLGDHITLFLFDIPAKFFMHFSYNQQQNEATAHVSRQLRNSAYFRKRSGSRYSDISGIGDQIPAGVKTFIFHKSSAVAVKPTKHFIPWVVGTFSYFAEAARTWLWSLATV
jgi:hypothetical protein